MLLADSAPNKDPDDSFALVDFGDAMESREAKVPGLAETFKEDQDQESVLPREPSHVQMLAERHDSCAMTAAQARKGTFQPVVFSPQQ